MSRVGAIEIVGLVVGATRRRVGSSSCIQLTIMGSERGMGAVEGLTLFVVMIGLFGCIGIFAALKKFLRSSMVSESKSWLP